MPRSFLIKKVEKVVTGFFPWNPDTLAEGCCLQYQTADEIDCNTDVEFSGSEEGKLFFIIVFRTRELSNFPIWNILFYVPFWFLAQTFARIKTSF